MRGRRVGSRKRTVADLALFGGEASFCDTLHVGRPNVATWKGLAGRIESVIGSRWLSNDGERVREFEAKVASMLDVRHCIATANGTLGLELAARALDLSGEVIVPSFTFIATAHSLAWHGLTPVFCDIDPATHNLDPTKVEPLIGPRTTAILPVHLWGRPCPIAALAEIARRHRLRLLYDASHAFGCTHEGRAVGGFGDAETLSFHATKFVTCGEGGAVVTNDDEIAQRLRLSRNFGFRGLDDVGCLGTNGKMSEFAAVVGLTSLQAMAGIVAVNRRNYLAYDEGLRHTPGISLLRFDDSQRCNYQYVVVEVDEAESGISRDSLLALLHAENVRARRYFWPGCHRMEPYASNDPSAHLRLQDTERVADRVLVLPTGEAATHEAIELICDLLRFATEHGAEIEAATKRG